MKKMILSHIFVLFFYINSYGAACLAPLGGGDAFPWSVAQPFPWEKIQGQWKVQGVTNYIFKFVIDKKVAGYSSLNIEIYDKRNCSSPLQTMLGIMSEAEPNVIRAKFSDKMMKIALFNSMDLHLKNTGCGENILATSIYDLNEDPAFSLYDSADTTAKSLADMMLKKTTNSLDIKCPKKQ